MATNSHIKDWKFYNPIFEYEKFIHLGGPWAGHKYFAYDLIRFLSPAKVVELGAHLGCSLFSFSQAVKDGKLNTALDAIDTWKGDKHAGEYGEIIFNKVKEIKRKRYSKVRINLIRTTFDEANGRYAKGSIDLLHIDGLHTYKAVKHDFDSWIDKVKDDGVILMHDISVKQWGFGIYKLWKEIKENYRTLEFNHSYGLGVIFKNGSVFKKVEALEQIFKVYYPAVAQREEYRWEAENKQTKITQLELKIEHIESSRPYKIWQLYKTIKNLLV